MSNNAIDNQPSDIGIEKIALQIKSLEQRTTSVTLPRNASVLQLKHEIQIACDVECNRQRLIFQGRVLKDDKNLTDYANLDNGKVVHLVIRPADAPHNPLNDDPTTAAANARNARGRPFPYTPGRFPMMEGYAFITLDSTLGELGDNNSLISSVLNGLTSSNRARNSPTQQQPITDTPSNNTSSTTNRSTTTSLSSLLRSPFSFSFGQRGSPGEQRPSLASSTLGFPPSVEVRLARTLASMRNVRTMLNESSNEDITSTLGVSSTTEQLQEIRNRLRNSGGSQLTQVGAALDELADLVAETIPRMRDVAQRMREAPTENDRDINRQVLFVSRIVQGMSLINHFMGSVLATVDVDSRRPRSGAVRTMRADTQQQPLRTNITVTTDSEVPTASASTATKRKNEQDDVDEPEKKAKQEKGKGKDKTD
ncbi:hypothetical protein G6F37_005101 [Rhizopus arrhizus]|nr:hypothetical protein G6F38_008464 [Rhizopus arrhizus]KAG1159210.1 hypothetical protein G6F37_005101 [Rhizopus arrhizus]